MNQHKEPKSLAEVANWCIVNALRLPSELKISIAAKIMQHLTDDERKEVVRLSDTVELGEPASPQHNINPAPGPDLRAAKRSFSDGLVVIDGKATPIRELPKHEYESFLNDMHKLRLFYIAVLSHH